MKYYRNIDRCAYGGLSSTRDSSLGKKRVYGPDVYAVDTECFDAYYYDEGRARWTQYNSVTGRRKFKNLFCTPHAKHVEQKVKVPQKENVTHKENVTRINVTRICKLGRMTPHGSSFYNFIPYQDRQSVSKILIFF